ncbi:MAG: S8 family serine peptidase [Verrucomicrobia bacterium]|nr:S8 family serine peptidase [Verrucomicrobiota bacterium]
MIRKALLGSWTVALMFAANTFAGGGPDVVPNSYIVQVKKGADVLKTARFTEIFTGGKRGHVYSKALSGFSIQVPPGIVKADILASPGVKHVEPDLMLHALEQTLPTGVDRIEADQNTTDVTGVGIAIIDTGIDTDHPDLPPVLSGAHFYTVNTGPPWSRGTFQDGNYEDDNGHGTHCAGIAAALDNDEGVVGIAPGANLYAVKVLDSEGAGYLSDIIAGVDWVTQNAGSIAVANMSLGGQGVSDAYRTAIANSVAAGVVYMVAAGNSGVDIYGTDGAFGTSDDYIPAAYPEVATISAMADSDGQPGGNGADTTYGSDDSFAGFSNFSGSVVNDNPVDSIGAAIDLLLPGVDIVSTYLDGGLAEASGTSMAAPHAAGLAALYIAEQGTRDATGDGVVNHEDVYAIRQALIDAAMAQDSANGLATLNDPDGNLENLGWAAPAMDVHDVAVTDITAPASVVVGEPVTINVSVANQGAFEETFNVVLKDDTDIEQIGSEPVTLTVGGSTTLTFTWDTTGATIGDHTLTAAHNAVDNNPGNNSISTTVTVSEAVDTMHVGDLDGAKNVKGKSGNWEVFVTVTIHDGNCAPVADATVTGAWSGAISGTASGMTAGDGTVTFATDTMKGGSSVTFAVEGVQGTLNYDSGDNHDPDADSNGTIITVNY